MDSVFTVWFTNNHMENKILTLNSGYSIHFALWWLVIVWRQSCYWANKAVSSKFTTFGTTDLRCWYDLCCFPFKLACGIFLLDIADSKDLPDVNTDDDIKKRPGSTTISFAGVRLSTNRNSNCHFLYEGSNTEGVFHTCPCKHYNRLHCRNLIESLIDFIWLKINV